MMNIFLNPVAGRGKALEKWMAAEKAMRGRLGELRLWQGESKEHFRTLVHEALGHGETMLIAAGGDGTLQNLLDAVMAYYQGKAIPASVQIGAIGLGTSNDFHKPVQPERCVEGIPVRVKGPGKIDDLMRLTVTTPQGAEEQRFFLQASHVGTIPEANDRLTRRPGFLRWLYKVHYQMALNVTAFWTVFFHEGFEGEIRIGEEVVSGLFSGLTLLKRCNIAGQFVFSSKRTPDDGLMDMGLCRKVKGFRLIQLTMEFEKQGFGGHPEVVFREAPRVEAKFAKPQTLDFDGELIEATQARWEVLPRAITILD